MADIPWDLTREGRWQVRVRNLSEAPRFYVKVTGPQVTKTWEWEVFDAGATKLIRVMPGDDAGPEVDISWYDTIDMSDEPRRWQAQTVDTVNGIPTSPVRLR